MHQVIELERRGFAFFIVHEKLKYRFLGEGLPDDSATSLLSEIKDNKEQVIAFLHARQEKQEVQNAIIAAFKGELKRPVFLPVLPEYKGILGAAVWLCPDEQSKQRVKDEENLRFTSAEFWHVCRLIAEQGEKARSVLECYRLFGSSILLSDMPINDAGKELSTSDSVLWVQLLTAAKKVDLDFTARLIFLRGSGCRLMPNEKTGYRLVPIIDESGCNGWVSEQVYNIEKQCLWPFKEKLIELLKEVH